jgi:hypothetical protein
MTSEQETALRIGLYVVGWAVSIAWPFILVNVTEGATFNWRLVSGRILAGAVGLLTFLVGDEVLASLGAMSFLAAFLAGFGASSAGRNVQRTADAARGK